MLQILTYWNPEKLGLVIPFHNHQILKIKPSICGALCLNRNRCCAGDGQISMVGLGESDPSLPLSGIGPGTLLSWIIWNLWIARNQLIFQKREVPPEETIANAITEAHEWILIQEPSIKPPPPQPSNSLDPLSRASQLCLFTDAAWNSSSKSAGLGWIFDDAGSISSFSATTGSISSPLMAETLAM
ncbi:hypothetical protein F2Q69_00058892 [Brassica cretica]|uniref:RNase H type-1 domain-containing protein n=1 Tax=Brassica cretica TaxID=69181 RepID=A0A8S9RMM9_BRACR|nr:hypothetical protein F2Q69_00058892 [Brassica cretica]